MTGFIRSQIKRKTFRHLAQYAVLLCFALEYILLMLDEYWGNFPIEYLLLFLQAAFLAAAVKSKPAPKRALPLVLPVAVTVVSVALVYFFLPARIWLTTSRVLGTCLFAAGALCWNRARREPAQPLLNMYACAVSLHLCYLPLPIVTAMFDIPALWISRYVWAAILTLLLALCPVFFSAGRKRKSSV